MIAEEYQSPAVPESYEVEQATLGGILINPHSLAPIAAFLKADDFFDKNHRMIFEAMIELANRPDPVDILTVSDLMGQNATLDKLPGGSAYLAELGNACPSMLHGVHYAKIVHRKARNRDLMDLATTLMQAGAQDSDDDMAAIGRAEVMLTKLAEKRIDSESVSMRELTATMIEETEALMKSGAAAGIVPTQFRDLDHYTGGFANGDLIILGARPSMGKTALAGDLAMHIAGTGVGVGIFSIEMSRRKVRDRMIAQRSGVSTQQMRRGEMSEEDWGKIFDCLGPLSELPIYVEDPSSLSTLEFRAKARRMATQRNVGFIVVDYLQLMSASSAGGRRDSNRTQEVSEMSSTLKSVARELDVPVLGLSQLSRQPDLRPNHRPNLSDIRESGSVEADADIVLLLYRDVYYHPETPKPAMAELTVAKNRDGSTGDLRLYFDARLTTFKPWRHTGDEK